MDLFSYSLFIYFCFVYKYSFCKAIVLGFGGIKGVFELGFSRLEFEVLVPH